MSESRENADRYSDQNQELHAEVMRLQKQLQDAMKGKMKNTNSKDQPGNAGLENMQA